MEENSEQPPSKIPEGPSAQEMVKELRELFSEAGAALNKPEDGEGDREAAKPFLVRIYNSLIALNKRDKGDPLFHHTVWIWNPDGDLTEKEFNELNLLRKELSNAVGIMTQSGVVRHDLNKI